jgi:hypothetical protein
MVAGGSECGYRLVNTGTRGFIPRIAVAPVCRFQCRWTVSNPGEQTVARPLLFPVSRYVFFTRSKQE